MKELKKITLHETPGLADSKGLANSHTVSSQCNFCRKLLLFRALGEAQMYRILLRGNGSTIQVKEPIFKMYL